MTVKYIEDNISIVYGMVQEKFSLLTGHFIKVFLRPAQKKDLENMIAAKSRRAMTKAARMVSNFGAAKLPMYLASAGRSGCASAVFGNKAPMAMAAPDREVFLMKFLLSSMLITIFFDCK